MASKKSSKDKRGSKGKKMSIVAAVRKVVSKRGSKGKKMSIVAAVRKVVSKRGSKKDQERVMQRN